MPYPILSILSSFLCLALLIAVSFFAGHFLLKFSGNRISSGFFRQIFFNSLTGSLLIVFLVSVFITKGKTVNVIFIIAAVLLYLENKKYRNPTENISAILKGNLPKLLFCLLALCFVFLWSVFSGNGIEIHALYYGEVSKSIFRSGIENTFTISNFFGDEYHYPTPYHYTDLWLNAVTAYFSGSDHAEQLYLVTYPFFSFIFICGLLAIAEEYVEIKYFHLLAAILCLFAGGLLVTFFLPGFANYSARMLAPAERCYGSQLLPAYCLGLAALLSFQHGKKQTGYILLMVTALTSIVFLPALLGGLSIYFLIQFIRKKDERKYWLRMLLYEILIFIPIILFYEVFQKGNLNYRMDLPLKGYTDWKDWSWPGIKFFVGEIVDKSWPVPFLIVLNYLPFLLPFIFLKKLPDFIKAFIFPMILICMSGLFASQFLYKMEDSHEFFINVMIIFHVLLYTAFIFTLCSANLSLSRRRIVTIPFLSACLLNVIIIFFLYQVSSNKMKFSSDYVAGINASLKLEKGDLYGGIISETIERKSVSGAVSAEFSLLHHSYFEFPPLNNPRVFIPLNLNTEGFDSLFVLKNPFSRFASDKKRINPSISYSEITSMFVEEKKLRYLVLKGRNHDKWIEKLNVKKIISDELSGQKFVLLQN